MKDIQILGGVRTPMAEYNGSFSDLSATDLGVLVAVEALKRASFTPDEIDHVIFVVVWSGSVAGRRAGRSCSFAAVTAAFASSGPRNGRCPFTISQNLAPKPETIIMLKTGKQHIESLRDGRTVYLHGKRIEDTTIHPAFRNAVRVAFTHSPGSCSLAPGGRLGIRS